MQIKEDQLILVDINDNQIGEAGKLEAHVNSCLHRAFSVFLYKDGKMLIQKRAKDKYHSGGLIANTCCSHPRVGEELIDAVERRMMEECGVKCQVEELTSFIYRERFADMCEYEYDHVFIGEYDGDFVCNYDEAEEMWYEDIEFIAEDICAHPEKYCAWFIIAFPMVYTHIKNGEN